MRFVFSVKKLAVLLLVFCVSYLWAENEFSDATGEEQQISSALLDNDYYRESLKQRSLARLALLEGNYDEAAWHASEAERFALLSDELIKKLFQSQVDTAIRNAADRIAWAEEKEAKEYFPVQLENAQNHYTTAVALRSSGELHGALENALAVQNDLAAVAAPPPKDSRGNLILPSNLPVEPEQYTVRPWDVFGDCFWNIAARFYADPHKWTVLYEANKHKIPDIDNPNLIEVGTVIDIPNITNKKRSGAYDTGTPYQQ